MARIIYRTTDGVQVPSVTQVTEKFKDPSGLMGWVYACAMRGENYRQLSKTAMDRGTAVHLFAAAKLTGEPVEADTEHKRILAAWLDGQAAPTEVIAIERSFVSEQYLYGGTVDAVLRWGDSVALLDWKCAKAIYPGYLMQIAAYGHLIQETLGIRVTDYCLVQIQETGVVEHSFAPNHMAAAFRSFLALRQAFAEQKLLEDLAAGKRPLLDKDGRVDLQQQLAASLEGLATAKRRR